jgi:hypothetical protein
MSLVILQSPSEYMFIKLLEVLPTFEQGCFNVRKSIMHHLSVVYSILIDADPLNDSIPNRLLHGLVHANPAGQG